jgi:Fe-S cluster biogenesis protein NfuA
VNLVVHFRTFKEKINKSLQELYHEAKRVVQGEIDARMEDLEERPY